MGALNGFDRRTGLSLRDQAKSAMGFQDCWFFRFVCFLCAGELGVGALVSLGVPGANRGIGQVQVGYTCGDMVGALNHANRTCGTRGTGRPGALKTMHVAPVFQEKWAIKEA